MSYNGSGTFSINSAGQPVVTGTVISSTAFNALTADLATGLSTAITKDGQTTTTARILFAQGVSSTLTTDATSTTTGSIITAGGISTQKALFVGTTSNFAGTMTAAAANFSGAITAAGTGGTLAATISMNANTTGEPAYFSAGGTDTNVGIDLNTKGTGSLRLNVGSTVAVTVANGSKVGIGGTPSTQALNIFGTSVSTTSANPAGIRFYDNGFSTAAHIVIRNVALQYNVPTGGAHSFGINDSEAARIDSSGNLLVGTTNNSSTVGIGIKFRPNQNGGISEVNSSSTNGADSLNMYSSTAAAFRFYVDWGGTIHATSATITAISDRTLKTNIRPLDTGLKEIMGLQPRRFDWINGDGENVVGFVAQEVEEVLPELVTFSKYSLDENGDVVTKKAVKTGDIIPTLVKAIQELTTRLAALETK